MKKFLFGFVAFSAIILGLQSCNEDIQLTGDFRETAVIYGLLDQSDSIHMIKITRAFIGPGNALEIAQIPDSNYFESVEGTITEYVSGVKARVFTLRDTLVDNKETNGAFYAPQQKLYYFATTSTAPLLGTAEYQMDLVINGGKFEISGRTKMVNGIANTNISGSNQPYRFVDNNGDFIPTTVTLSSVGTSYQVNVKLDIEFTEWEGTSPTVRHAIWGLGESSSQPGDSKAFTANGATFYSNIASNCSSNQAVTRRTLNSITAIITGAAEDLVNYIQVNEPSSSLAQSKPTYTNLTATNGASVVGIFSARQTITIYKPFIDPGGNSNIRCLNKKSTEYLCVGSITAPYLFCSDHPADIASGESWACN